MCDETFHRVTISMDFKGCPEHETFQVIGGSMDLGVVDSFDVVDATFGAMEEVIGQRLVQLPEVRELIGWKYTHNGSPEVSLEERTQRLLVKLLAHQLMLSRVAGREYSTSSRSAMLTIPGPDSD